MFTSATGPTSPLCRAVPCRAAQCRAAGVGDPSCLYLWSRLTPLLSWSFRGGTPAAVGWFSLSLRKVGGQSQTRFFLPQRLPVILLFIPLSTLAVSALL